MSSEQTATPVERARAFAALSGPFDPVALLDAIGDVDAAVAMDVTVDLASVCDTSDPTGWLLRGTVRRDRLSAMAADQALESALDWRRQRSSDPATDDLLDALAGAGPYTESGIATLLEQPVARDPLTRIAVALERAGAQAPAHHALESVRSALGRADAAAAGDAASGRGFSGRGPEIERAVQWLKHPQTRRPVRALSLMGSPETGTSAFLDEVVRQASVQAPPWLIVRLDFERGGLDVQDRVGLTMEIGRQVSRELGADAAHIRAARLLTAGAGVSTGPNVKGAGRDRIPDELSLVLGDAIRAGGRPVLLILDTMEVLRGRGETHPLRLFETLDELCERGLRPLAVIAAGRDPALESVPDRVGGRIELGGSNEDSAAHMVRSARGDRTSKFRSSSASTRPVDYDSAAVELELTLGRGDIREAESVYGRSFGKYPGGASDQRPVDPASPAADVARAFLWRAGRWSEALRDFDPRRWFAEGYRDRSPVVTLAMLEVWAESRFAEVSRAFMARPDLAELATELRARGLAGSLASGALGFALLHAGAVPQPASSLTPDAVDAAAALWSPSTAWTPGAPESAVLDALAAPIRRFTAHVSPPRGVDGPTARPPDLSTPAGAARVLASETPYVSVVEAFRNLDRGTALLDRLALMDRALAAAGGIPPRGAGDWSLAPALSRDGSIQNLATLGLLAEALSASGFLMRHPDLRLIARSAELWRRTCAGDWAYASPPAGRPTWSQHPDTSIRDGVAQLTSRRDCLEQIRIWTGVDSDEQVLGMFRRLRRHYPAADRAARQQNAQDAAAALLASHVPSAFVPAMAVLYSMEGKSS